MLLAIIVMAIIIASQNVTIGYSTVYEYEEEPKIKDFLTFDDAMEYADLRKTGWRGDINDFYKWKEEE